jgi:hypothetical protein
MGVNRGNGGRVRSWYPSGPWVDAPSRSSTSNNYDSYSSPPPKVELGNPDPTDYKLIFATDIGNILVMKINYPNCTNFEGNKILVFKDISLIGLINQKFIDPHFNNSKEIKSPIARFEPTEEGWDNALKFAELIKDKADK